MGMINTRQGQTCILLWLIRDSHLINSYRVLLVLDGYDEDIPGETKTWINYSRLSMILTKDSELIKSYKNSVLLIEDSEVLNSYRNLVLFAKDRKLIKSHRNSVLLTEDSELIKSRRNSVLLTEDSELIKSLRNSVVFFLLKTVN